MSRYIDSDTLIRYGKCGTLVYWEDIENAPSIDIVRCGECKYKQQCHKAVEHTTRDITSVTIAYRPIDFCSYGEREGE